MAELINLLMESEKLIKKQTARLELLEKQLLNEREEVKNKIKLCEFNQTKNQSNGIITSMLATISQQESTIENLK